MPFTYTKSLDITLRPDVLVCGAGLAGIGGRLCQLLAELAEQLKHSPRYHSIHDQERGAGVPGS